MRDLWTLLPLAAIGASGWIACGCLLLSRAMRVAWWELHPRKAGHRA